jgi:hypothetical protein
MPEQITKSQMPNPSMHGKKTSALAKGNVDWGGGKDWVEGM